MNASALFFNGPNGRIAYERIERGRGDGAPGIVWLGGFKSDMTGTKAGYLADWARANDRAYLRFDYSGHGQSDRKFEDGCISDWTADAIAAFDALSEGRQILVGSSMGAWVATLLALARPERIAGIVFIAPAPDFTEELIWKAMSDENRKTIMRDGKITEASDYADEPTILTRKLIEDGRNNLVLGGPVNIGAPVRILHGMADQDVPYAHALRFAERLTTDDLEITLAKTGDHSLSGPEDLARLASAIEAVG